MRLIRPLSSSYKATLGAPETGGKISYYCPKSKLTRLTWTTINITVPLLSISTTSTSTLDPPALCRINLSYFQ